MSVDLRVNVPNRPGALVGALQVLLDAGVEVLAASADNRPGERWSYVHVLTDHAEAGRKAFEAAHIEVTGEHEVALREIEAHRGVLVELFNEYSSKGDNIEVLYMAPDGRWVIGTESMRRERRGLKVDEATY